MIESIKMSPLRSVLRKKYFRCERDNQEVLQTKTNESIDSLLDLIAPKQGQDLKEEVIPTLSCAQMQKDKEADVILTLTKLYVDTVDNFILSVISSKLTKAEIQSLIPGINIYRIDQARQQLNTSSERERGLHVREKLKVPRRRMDEDKLQHAISLFFDPSFMQLVSYGTKDLKLESGAIITIPDVIRTTSDTKKPGPKRKLTKFHEFLLTLFRVRFVLSAFVIRDSFGVSKTRISQTDYSWINNMFQVFEILTKMANTTELQKTYAKLIQEDIFSYESRNRRY